jgi:DNA-binding HxlR family transcriptional regulator
MSDETNTRPPRTTPEADTPTGNCTPTLPGFTCGLDATLRVISGKWKPLILYFVAQDGPTRYGALRRAVRDVSDKMLIQHLKELEADGLVKRTDYKEIPPRVDYSLTPLGGSLAQALVPLCTWGTENMAAVAQAFAERDATAASTPTSSTSKAS